MRLVRRSLERGFYQGWDLHPAQLPTRYAATFAFFRDGFTRRPRGCAPTSAQRDSAILDEPATARALADFLVRGLDCGALDRAEVPAATGLGAGRADAARARQPGTEADVGIVLGPNRTARRRTASSASTATPSATRSATSTCRRRCAATSTAAHVDGDQSAVLPTDTQKNTAFAYAKEHGVASPEDYAIALGRRLLTATPAATGARVGVEEYAWDRIRRRRRPRPRVRTPGRRGPHHRGRRGPRRERRRLRPHRPGGAEVDRLGVQGLPARRVHHPARGRRPDPGDVAHRRGAGATTASDGRRLERGVRATSAACCCERSRRRTAVRCRRPCTRWAARRWRRSPRSSRSRSPPPTSTTTSSTSRLRARQPG